jgi:hypothetical protein
MSDQDKPTYDELVVALSAHFADERIFLRRPRTVRAEAMLGIQHESKVHTRVANVTFQLFDKLDVQLMDSDPDFWVKALVGWETLLGGDYQPVAYSADFVRQMAERHHFRQAMLPIYLQAWMAASSEEHPVE